MAMRIEQSVEINASPETVYGIMADVERWAEWTPSIVRIERLESGAFAVGSSARVWQPRSPAALWRVTQITPDRGFAWEAPRPGMYGWGGHYVEPMADGRSRATLTFEARGWLASLLWPFIGSTARKFVAWEAAGLKRRAEDPTYSIK
jgi:hypothetical protein